MFMKLDIGLPLGMHFVVFRKLAHWEPPVTSPVMWDVAGYSAAQALSPWRGAFTPWLSGKPLKQGLFEDGSSLAPARPMCGGWEPLLHPCLWGSSVHSQCCSLTSSECRSLAQLSPGLSPLDSSAKSDTSPQRRPWSSHTRSQNGEEGKTPLFFPLLGGQGTGVGIEPSESFFREILALGLFQLPACCTLKIDARLGIDKWGPCKACGACDSYYFVVSLGADKQNEPQFSMLHTLK